MRTVSVGTITSGGPTTSFTAGTLIDKFRHKCGLTQLNEDEANAALESINKYARWARERARWPEATRVKQVIPDVRVRSVAVNNGGSGYTSAPTVTIAAPGGGGTQATGTATINADGEVNGIAVTNEGSGYASVPAVSFAGGAGSGAEATASLNAYIDFGTDGDSTDTIYELFRVTEDDPCSGNYGATEIPFKLVYDNVDAAELGEALLMNRTSTAPVWITYGFPKAIYASGDTDFLYVWSEYAIQGAYADWLHATRQTEKAQVAEGRAEEIIINELDRLERQQGQTTFTQYTTHHTTVPWN